MAKFNWRRAFEIFVAEFLGTSVLVLIGCAGVVYGMLIDFSPLLLASFDFGIAIGLVIMIFGNISTHVNPIITIVGVILGIIPLIYYPVYFVAQILGGIFGMSLLRLVSPEDMFNLEEIKVLNETIPITPVCCTVPSPELTNMHAVGVEIIISFLLCLVFCSISDNRSKDCYESIAIKFAITVASLGLSFGSYTGASMNPARSFGPAVINNYWKDHWVYWMGPFIGSILAAVLWKYLFFVRPVPSVIK